MDLGNKNLGSVVEGGDYKTKQLKGWDLSNLLVYPLEVGANESRHSCGLPWLKDFLEAISQPPLETSANMKRKTFKLGFAPWWTSMSRTICSINLNSLLCKCKWNILLWRRYHKTKHVKYSTPRCHLANDKAVSHFKTMIKLW